MSATQQWLIAAGSVTVIWIVLVIILACTGPKDNRIETSTSWDMTLYVWFVAFIVMIILWIITVWTWVHSFFT